MATPKKYFHDRLVLLLLSINAFLALACSIYILLRVDPDGSATYAVQYRARLGINAFKSGSSAEIYSIVVFALLVFGFHFYLSRKSYPIKRHFSIAFLGLGTLLLTLSIFVSYALLLY